MCWPVARQKYQKYFWNIVFMRLFFVLFFFFFTNKQWHIPTYIILLKYSICYVKCPLILKCFHCTFFFFFWWWRSTPFKRSMIYPCVRYRVLTPTLGGLMNWLFIAWRTTSSIPAISRTRTSSIIYKTYIEMIGFIFYFWCFKATFSSISAISWRPVLVVEEAGIPGENQRPWASNW